MMAQQKQPRIKMKSKEESVGPVSPGEMLQRLIVAVLAILNPVIAALGFLVLPMFTWQQKIKARWLVIGALTATVVSVLLGASRAYLFPYFAIGQVISEGIAANGLAALSPGRESAVWSKLGAEIGAHWAEWLIGQLPFALVIACLYASLRAAYRSRYRAEWRTKEKPATARQVERAMRKLPRWHQKASDVYALAQLEVLMGVDRFTAKPFSLPAAAFGKHCYIDGPSGFGKTTDLITIMRGLIEAPAAQRFRIGMVYLNMKPDPDITDAVRELAATAGRRLTIITEDGIGSTTTYNPLKHGSAQQARNILIEAEALAADGGFSESHYRRSGERFTLLCLEVLDELVGMQAKYKSWNGTMQVWQRDLHHVTRLMDTKELFSHDSRVSAELSQKLKSYQAELQGDKDLAKGGSGLRQRFAGAIEGAAGNVLRESPAGLDLREAILRGDVVLFNLDAARDAQAARQIGNLALQDITAAFGDLGSRRWHRYRGRSKTAAFWAKNVWLPLRRKLGPTPPAVGKLDGWFRGRLVSWSQGKMEQNRMGYIVVDEFSALGGSLLQSLFERARSNGGAVTLATQVSTALEEASMSFKDSVIKNSNVKVLHQQDTNAEEYAGLIGTEKGMAETTQIFDDKDELGMTTRASGQGSLREVEQFRVHPNELRDLEPGQAIIFTKTPAVQHRVKVRRMTASGGRVEPPTETPALPSFPAPTAEPPRTEPASATPAAPADDPFEEAARPEPAAAWAAAAAHARTATVEKSAATPKANDDWLDHSPGASEPPPEDD